MPQLEWRPGQMAQVDRQSGDAGEIRVEGQYLQRSRMNGSWGLQQQELREPRRSTTACDYDQMEIGCTNAEQAHKL